MVNIVSIGGRGRPPPQNEPDAHGQAALLLAESILHVLVETATISIGQAVSIVESAQAVQVEVAKLTEESRSRMDESRHLLDQIARSLTSDLF